MILTFKLLSSPRHRRRFSQDDENITYRIIYNGYPIFLKKALRHYNSIKQKEKERHSSLDAVDKAIFKTRIATEKKEWETENSERCPKAIEAYQILLKNGGKIPDKPPISQSKRYEVAKNMQSMNWAVTYSSGAIVLIQFGTFTASALLPIDTLPSLSAQMTLQLLAAAVSVYAANRPENLQPGLCSKQKSPRLLNLSITFEDFPEDFVPFYRKVQLAEDEFFEQSGYAPLGDSSLFESVDAIPISQYFLRAQSVLAVSGFLAIALVYGLDQSDEFSLDSAKSILSNVLAGAELIINLLLLLAMFTSWGQNRLFLHEKHGLLPHEPDSFAVTPGYRRAPTVSSLSSPSSSNRNPRGPSEPIQIPGNRSAQTGEITATPRDQGSTQSLPHSYKFSSLP